MKKITIIMPVFNKEKYIRETIESVLNQTLNEFEFIIIDDGSTDKSGIISDVYARKDERIRVIHIPNGGVSNARNIGLDMAEGEYITFIDADDRVTEGYLENLYDCITNSKADMVISGYKKVWAALAKGEDCLGPDLIYLPELPFDIEAFSEKVKDLLAKKPSVVVAVSEGIRLADGRYVCELGQSVDFVDAFGHKQLSGTANYLASYIAGEFGCKTRAIELSTLQRSASHCASRVDILEAYQVGGAAVKAADEGDSGKMVVLQRLSDDPYQCGTEVKDVHKIANDEKVVPREWVTEDGSYVTDDFVSYVRPLIQGDVSPVMVDGIPRHLYRKN